jgi:hypothetical protein
MDAIVTAALVGTAQQNKIDITTSTPLDTLTQKLPEGETERKLLLSAGARAVYRQAGYVAESILEIPELAPPESLPACSRRVLSLLRDMFEGEHRELLPEALERLRNAGLRLPHELLPMALNVQPPELRSSVFPVLGERGRWLSQFNPDWSWVAQYLPGTKDTLPADAETLWQEGTLGQRTIILRLMRETDPAKARCWLERVWKQEKAEARAQLLGTFETGLSTDDEPFLEKALDDKAGAVRSAASLLLARIPTSAFAQRIQTRAAAMLNFSSGSLIVTLPHEIGKDWQRDGIAISPPTGIGIGIGERAYWFKQVMALVHPGFWEEQFGVPANELIIAASLNDEWHEILISGWSKAATLHDSGKWIPPLWEWCYSKSGTPIWGIHVSLLSHVSPQEAERRVIRIIDDANDLDADIWVQALSTLPHPWSKEFGDAYLHRLHNYVSSLKFKKQGFPYYDSWYKSVAIATVALPSACFAGAVERFVIPDISEATFTNAQWQKVQWQQTLKNFVEAIRLRQRIVKEIV